MPPWRLLLAAVSVWLGASLPVPLAGERVGEGPGAPSKPEAFATVKRAGALESDQLGLESWLPQPLIR